MVSGATAPPPLRLAGLDPDAHYLDRITGQTHHGAVLTAHGLDTGLTTDYASTLLHLYRHHT